MKLLAPLLAAFMPVVAQARGWSTVHRYVHPTDRCGSAREVMASWYAPDGHRTASGRSYGGLSIAARDYPLGTRLTLSDPRNGRSVRVTVTDRGPFGEAWAQGDRLDLQNEPADALGGRDTRYVCVSE
jgi:rare lipoprotein A (peptidoglycan hydrolase)